MKDFRVSLASGASREKTENGRRGLWVPFTEPGKIMIVAKATHKVQKSFAAPLDQAPAVGDGDRGGSAPKRRCMRSSDAVIRLQMQLSRRKQHWRRCAETSQECKRDLPISRGRQRNRASRAKPKRDTIPMRIPVCESH